MRTLSFLHSSLIPNDKIGSRYSNLFDITDWFPTLLDAGKCSQKNLPNQLDGKSHFENFFSAGNASVRDEIVHHLDPLKKADAEVEDPRPFVKVYGFKYDIRMKTAIRVGKYKLITGAEATKTPLQNQAELDLLSKSSFFVKNSWLKTKKYQKLVVLYDIEDDPRELKDISDENQSVVIQLLSKVLKK